jgi:hypothetical protein
VAGTATAFADGMRSSLIGAPFISPSTLAPPPKCNQINQPVCSSELVTRR